ncbi:probable G-protein coupled receptor 132 [Sarcophilus harrisii]|uniref:G-protein coupled receptors family 1 profile domain-containing protein n=1 Tax=Sarcophilus harrisii TaxID=9305 RepID=G3VQL0_SARHA|nr:probable G-protein coupled receptor 132 [Sarcophilus harrisii]
MNYTNMTHCSVNFEISKTMRLSMFSLVLSAGLPLNCMAAWFLLCQIRTKSILSIYMINMVATNLLQILTIPFWIHYTYLGHRWILGRETCIAISFLFTTNLYAKVAFLCLIAKERYFNIVFPMRCHGLGTISIAVKISFSAWMFTVFFCILGSYLIYEEKEETEFCHEGYPVTQKYALFKMYTMFFSFFGPLGLIGFFYGSILYKVREMRNLETKKEVYGCILLTMVTFILVFGPYQVTSFLKNFLESRKRGSDFCAKEEALFLPREISLCMMTLGNILDPVLYVLLIKSTRDKFIASCKCLCFSHQ